MSLTTTQHDLLVKYLKGLEIKTQEPFEEFYDHIATAIEKEQPDDINEFLREVIQPSFGGVKGIKRILLNQRELRQKLIWKRAKKIFWSLFGWPSIVLIMIGFILVQICSNQFGLKFTMGLTLSLGLFLPFLIYLIAAIRLFILFGYENKPYNSTESLKAIFTLIHIPIALLNVLNFLIVPIIFGRGAFTTFLLNNVWANTLLCAFALLYGFTCLKLLKENFTFKLELK